MFQDVREIRSRPDLRPFYIAQQVAAGDMVIVIVSWQDNVNLLHAKLRLERGQGVEPWTTRSAIVARWDTGHEVITKIDKQSFTAFGEQNVGDGHAGPVHQEMRSPMTTRSFPIRQYRLIRMFAQLK